MPSAGRQGWLHHLTAAMASQESPFSILALCSATIATHLAYPATLFSHALLTHHSLIRLPPRDPPALTLNACILISTTLSREKGGGIIITNISSYIGKLTRLLLLAFEIKRPLLSSPFQFKV